MKTIASIERTWRRAALGVLAAAALSACAQGLATNDVTPEPVAAAPTGPAAAPGQAATTPAQQAPPERAPRRANAAARAASPAPIEAAATTYLTPQEINGECWMQVENNRAVRDIDARLKLVEKCVAEKTKAQQAQRPAPQ